MTIQRREKDVENWLRKEIEKLGGTFYKWVSPGQDGVPDRIAIFPDGRVVFVELKAWDGRLTPVQRSQLKRLQDLGQTVVVVRGLAGAISFIENMAGKK